MTSRSLTAALAVALCSLAARGADDDNPYKSAKVGDFAVYTTKVSYGTLMLEGKTKQQVTAKTEKDAKVKVAAGVGGMEVPPQEQTIDLTKPYDPTKVGGLPPGTEAKVEKGQTGTEKIKLGTRDYDTTWISYKVKAKANGMEFDAEVKVWSAKNVPLGMVKMQLTATIAKEELTITMEIAESGNQPVTP